MKAKRFDRPVSIFVGLGFPRDVETVLEAHQVLTEWPGKRDATHEAALATCRAALAGQADAKAVRAVFEAFARERGILGPEALAASARAAAQDWLGA